MTLNGSVGQHLYEKYGCDRCHGKTRDGLLTFATSRSNSLRMKNLRPS